MLSFFSIELDFFVTLFKKTCHYTGSGSSSCYINTSGISKDTVIGLLSFLIVLVLFELACSIGSVVVSCKAYSKCCNTYNTNDCCAFVGCCECDCRPLNVQQVSRPFHVVCTRSCACTHTRANHIVRVVDRTRKHLFLNVCS